MNKPFQLVYFNPHSKDWTEYKSFRSREDAEQYVEGYPRFGQILSRLIREGNWQIIEQ